MISLIGVWTNALVKSKAFTDHLILLKKKTKVVMSKVMPLEKSGLDINSKMLLESVN